MLQCIFLVKEFSILFERESAIRDDIQVRVSLWLKYGTPSYMINIFLSFEYTGFCTYIKEIPEWVYQCARAKRCLNYINEGSSSNKYS